MYISVINFLRDLRYERDHNESLAKRDDLSLLAPKSLR